MSGSRAVKRGEGLPSIEKGRFIPSLRNRPIGREEVRLMHTLGGRIQLAAETAMLINGVPFRQAVIAEYDGDLRPAWCSVTTTIRSREVHFDLECDTGRAKLRSFENGTITTRKVDLERQGVLLVDNCFSTHGMAALLCSRSAKGSGRFTSLPAFEELLVMPRHRDPILLGGADFGRPAISLSLIPGLEEHVWIDHFWVTRIVIPRFQARIDWKEAGDGQGGSP